MNKTAASDCSVLKTLFGVKHRHAPEMWPKILIFSNTETFWKGKGKAEMYFCLLTENIEMEKDKEY